MQEIKDPNHETANLAYIAMFMEQIGSLKEKYKVKNYIIQPLANLHNNISIAQQIITVIKRMIIIVILLIIMIIIKIIIFIIYIKVIIIFLTPLTTIN